MTIRGRISARTHRMPVIYRLVVLLARAKRDRRPSLLYIRICIRTREIFVEIARHAPVEHGPSVRCLSRVSAWFHHTVPCSTRAWNFYLEPEEIFLDRRVR